jgi:hypothetical protein
MTDDRNGRPPRETSGGGSRQRTTPHEPGPAAQRPGRRLARTAADLARVVEVATALHKACLAEDGRGIPAGLRHDVRKAAHEAFRGLSLAYALLAATRADEDARERG